MIAEASNDIRPGATGTYVPGRVLPENHNLWSAPWEGVQGRRPLLLVSNGKLLRSVISFLNTPLISAPVRLSPGDPTRVPPTWSLSCCQLQWKWHSGLKLPTFRVWRLGGAAAGRPEDASALHVSVMALFTLPGPSWGPDTQHVLSECMGKGNCWDMVANAY